MKNPIIEGLKVIGCAACRFIAIGAATFLAVNFGRVAVDIALDKDVEIEATNN